MSWLDFTYENCESMLKAYKKALRTDYVVLLLGFTMLMSEAFSIYKAGGWVAGMGFGGWLVTLLWQSMFLVEHRWQYKMEKERLGRLQAMRDSHEMQCAKDNYENSKRMYDDAAKNLQK
jgi:hypothetical protein